MPMAFDAAPQPKPHGAAPAPMDFRALYDAQLDYVWSSLRRLGVPPGNVEDLCHDVFLTAWRKLSDYDRSRPLRPWLFGIAFRLASDFRQRASTTREVSDPEADAVDSGSSPHDDAERSQARAMVRRALENIPLERRAVFVMHELDGAPIPEVAEALAIPLNTAYSRLRLARRDFQEAVARLQEAQR